MRRGTNNNYSASVEADYPFALPDHFDVESQLQLLGQHLSVHVAADADGLAVNIDSQNELIGRLGARMTRPFDIASGRLMPYPGIDVLYAFAGGKNVEISEARFTSGTIGDTVQSSVGVNGTNTPKISRSVAAFLTSSRSATRDSVAGC
ncbi:autotransporter domain-containing protein [Paraburkholderia sp. 40]|uniref:autotransporter domain-containing protein n=1 Tax=Paraburkholderia sp. 40 TaxID=2991059 RepID=UPI003D1F5032